MNEPRRSLLLLPALAVVAGCGAPCPVVVPADLPSAGAFVRGLVQAPKAYVAPAPGDGPADARAQVPAPRAEIAFADAAGQPIAGMFHGATDANGAFGVFKLPQGYTFVVQALVRTPEGKSVTLESLGAPSTSTSAQTPIDLATTLVTLAATKGLTGLAGDVDAATFDAATAAVRAHLTDQDPPPAVGGTAPLGFDRTAAEAQIQAMAQADATLASNLDKLKSQVAAPKLTPAQLKAEVAKAGDQDPLDALFPVY